MITPANQLQCTKCGMVLYSYRDLTGRQRHVHVGEFVACSDKWRIYKIVDGKPVFCGWLAERPAA